jgi:exosortase K
VKTKAALLLSAAAIAWALKWHYAGARADDLMWILAPTAHLAGLVTDTAFTMEPGEGYLSRERLFLIEKSCAGVNFIIAAFGMLTLARLPRAVSPLAAARQLTISLVVAYGAAVAVNAARIAIAMWLAERPLARLPADDVHRIEGVVVYFGGLLMLYEVTWWLDSRSRSPLTTR